MKYLIFLLLFISSNLLVSQSTYTSNGTEYYYGEYYSTTGYPKVKRSAKAKRKFLRSQGLSRLPYGYEIDHIIPLSQGGLDLPSNMQLLTIAQHDRKTAKERSSVSSATYSNYSYNYSYATKRKKPRSSSYNYNNKSSSTSSRTIHTGPRGGRYYINKNGNKTYVKR